MKVYRSNYLRVCGRRGFSLIELLTVIAIMALLSGVGNIAVQSLGQSQKVGTAAEQLREAVELARVRSMVTGVYHWVGIRPDVDGKNLLVRLYRATNPSANGSTIPGERYGREVKLPMVRISDSIGADGSRPSADATLSTTGAWLAVAPSGEIRLDAVTGFWSDQARSIEFQEPPTAMNRWIQIGLSPEVGPDSNFAVIQIAGLTGQTEIYRQ